MMVDLIDNFFAEYPARLGTSDKVDTGEADEVIVAIAKTVANYRRVIGVDPGRLAPGTPVDRLSPGTLPRAVAEGQAQHWRPVSYTHLDVYKRQVKYQPSGYGYLTASRYPGPGQCMVGSLTGAVASQSCLLYTSRCV